MNEERDYRRFLDEAGELRVRLLPRKVYTQIVNDYRRRDEVIDSVFEEMYLLWDLNEKLASLSHEDASPSKADAAQAVMDELDDPDWWRVMAAFERALKRDFIENAANWTEHLDPVYDDQVLAGWRDLQP